MSNHYKSIGLFLPRHDMCERKQSTQMRLHLFKSFIFCRQSGDIENVLNVRIDDSRNATIRNGALAFSPTMKAW